MSVQIRRRREAASFLQSFVGAGGELLVDTTNNRVQVHDGATPGGFPAAAVADLPGRNLLLNGTFAINQRGYASGATLGAGGYAHDRWKAGANGCAYTFAPAVPDTTVTITAGTLVQAVDAANVAATALWLTWTGTAGARLWQGAAAGAFSAGTRTVLGGVGVNALLATGLAAGTVVAVEFAAGTLGLVQLEAALPNAGPTRFERRLASVERQLCQAYYWTSKYGTPGGLNVGSVMGSAFLNYALLVNARFPVAMRATPSVAISNNGAAGQIRNSTNGNTYALNPNNFGTVSDGGFPFAANGGNTGLAVGTAYDFDIVANAEI